MKFVLILALCIFATQVNGIEIKNNESMFNFTSSMDFSKDGILQSIITFVQNLIKKTEQSLQAIMKKFEETITNANDIINNIIEDAQGLIKAIKDKTIKLLEEIAKRDEISSKCAEKYRPELDVVVAEHSLELKSCTENAVQQIRHISDEVQPHIEAIRDNIDALQDIVSDCLETTGTPLTLINCITSKANAIRIQLFKLIQNAQKVVSTGGIRIIEIVNETRQCVAQTNNIYHKKIDGIVDKVQKCIQDEQVKKQ